LFLPDREKAPFIPRGTTKLKADDREYEATFAKIALNVVHEPGMSENRLPQLLTSWFGPDAGQAGTAHRVQFQRDGDVWVMSPLDRASDARQAVPWHHYMREQIPPLFGLTFSTAIWNAGFVKQAGKLFLLATLDKEDLIADHRYEDHFLSPTVFQWQSQNRTTQRSAHGQDIAHHTQRGLSVHLFVRRAKKVGQRSAPFVYCGEVSFIDWEGDAPITVRWKLPLPVPESLRRSLKVPADSPNDPS
jgi:hypothetical protein